MSPEVVGQALEVPFRVRTQDPGIHEVVAWMFGGLMGPTLPGHVDEYVVELDPSWPGAHRLVRDGVVLLSRSSLASVLERLVWHVNHQALARTRGLLLLHASAVESDGTVVVFPGDSGSGKTTMAAALAVEGCGYVTDEAVALDPASLLVHPYPKPLSIRAGSWPFVSSLAPPRHGSFPDAFTDTWHASPMGTAGGVGRPGVPGLLISPLYRREGPPARLREVTRAEMLARLVTGAFAGATPLGERAEHLRALLALVRGSDCLDLVYTDLGAAVAEVQAAMERRRNREHGHEHARRCGVA